MSNYFNIKELSYNQNDLYNYYLKNTSSWATYGSGGDGSLYTQYIDLSQECIQYILNQFVDSSIISNVKFFKTLAKNSVSPHCDKRNVAINIPVQTNDDNYTVFYKDNGNYDNPNISVNGKVSEVSAKRFADVEPLSTVVIKNAICLNTSVPHGVKNNSDQDRILLSISFIDKYDDFNKIKELYNSGNLCKRK